MLSTIFTPEQYAARIKAALQGAPAPAPKAPAKPPPLTKEELEKALAAASAVPAGGAHGSR